MAPHDGAHRVAIRAGFCLAIPLLVLYIIGRTDLAIYASFGAFTAIYGRSDAYSARLAMQATAGTTILLAMMLGTGLSVLNIPPAIQVLVVAVMAGFVTILAHRLSWRPTGALFSVFGAGACASIPATGITFVHVLLVGGGAVVFSLIVTGVLASFQISLSKLVELPVPTPMLKKFKINAAMIFIAALVSGWVGLALLTDHWYWAMVAAIAVLVGAHIHARLTRGVQRFLGTLVGVVLASAVMWIDPPLLVVLALTIFCQGFIEMIVLRNYAAAMIFITLIALLMVNMASPLPQETLIRNRVFETLIGVIVGMTVTILAQFWDFE